METSAEGVRRTRRFRPSRDFGAVEPVAAEPVEPHDRILLINCALVGFVVFGVLIRLVRSLADRPLWGDEAMVAVNLLGRGFGELMEPLAFAQVAPIGFLWVERLVVVLLGPSEWSLRLAPAVCGIVAVPGFAWLARRAFNPVAALLAVAVFAVSYAPIRHAVEVKPYAFDLLAAIVLLLPAIVWLRQPERTGSLWLLVLLAPVAMICSHPATFVAGGIGVAMVPTLWAWAVKRPDWKLLRLWAVYLGVVGLAFLAVYTLSTGEQSDAVSSTYREGYWAAAFPPFDEPLRLPQWLLMTHVGESFGYPIGGENGASLVSTVLAVAGVIALWRGGNRGLVAVLLAPMGMTFLAAMLGRYPYGGSARTMQHLAPSLCLLIGAGAASILNRTVLEGGRDRRIKQVLVGLVLIGAGLFTTDLVMPYRTREDQRTRDFARWFWPEVARGAEVGCSRAMRGTTFDGTYWRLGRLELYLANQAIALPADRDTARPRLDRVSEDHPLRIVIYNDDPRFDLGLAAWLDVMSLHFQLRDVRSYTVNGGIIDHGMGREERFLVFEYVPFPENTRLARRSGG
ncbi:glycosyltransferase family 39 protein [Tautonia marina]|uniref:glycosyltransferase family 39 protein n=1 Tax=Tautonia marina TaxID=2653855 RepID=UPI001261019B|nr:glycosyltransferase family 39 protein [Tautonia marina]